MSYICGIHLCKAIFDSNEKCDAHRNRSHRCPIKGCQEIFKRPNNIKSHILMVHNNDGQ